MKNISTAILVLFILLINVNGYSGAIKFKTTTQSILQTYELFPIGELKDGKLIITANKKKLKTQWETFMAIGKPEKILLDKNTMVITFDTINGYLLTASSIGGTVNCAVSLYIYGDKLYEEVSAGGSCVSCSEKGLPMKNKQNDYWCKETNDSRICVKTVTMSDSPIFSLK